MRSTADSWEFPPPAGEGRSKGCRWWQKRASNEETRSGAASFVDGGSGGWSQRRKQRQGADAKSAPVKNLAVFNCDLRVYIDVVRMSNTGNPSPPKKTASPPPGMRSLFHIQLYVTAAVHRQLFVRFGLLQHRHTRDVRVGAFIPVQEAFHVDFVADLQLLHCLVDIGILVAQIGLHGERIRISVL